MLTAIVAVTLAAWAPLVFGAQPPSLNQPSSQTLNNPISVSGTATSGVTVRLYVNGDLVNTTTASTGGTYSTTVPLMDGSNTIHATTFDTAESAPSSARIVDFNVTRTAYLPVPWLIETATVLTRSQNHYYVADGTITIAAAGSLTIQPGVEVWFKPNAKIVATGRLWVRGKANNPVVLTGTNPDTGRWAGLEFRGANQLVENAVVERATTGVTFARVGSAQGSGTVRNSMIQDNITGVLIKPHSSSIAIGPGNWTRRNGDAFRIEGAVDTNGQLVAVTTYSPLINGNALLGTGMGIRVGQFHPAVSNLTINASGNWWDTTSNSTILSRIFDRADVEPAFQAYYALVNHITALASATTRPIFSGGYISPAVLTTREYGAGTYHLASPSYVMGGATVTFEAGAEVLVDIPQSGGPHAIEAQGGTITVTGTSAQPVTFKSGRTTPVVGDWAGIKIARDPSTLVAGALSMTFGDVRHAATGIRFDQSGGTVAQSVIRDNDIGVGVGIKGSPTLGTGNTITANRRGVEILGDGASVANNPNPVISGGSIHANTQFNAYANAFASAQTTTINARDNYWGSTSNVAIESSVFHRPDSPATAPLIDIFGYRDGPGGQPAVGILSPTMNPWEVKPSTGQSAVVQFILNAPASVTARVLAPADCLTGSTQLLGTYRCSNHAQIVSANNCAVLRTFGPTAMPAGPNSISWDGRPAAGSPTFVADTSFRVELSAAVGATSVIADPDPVRAGYNADLYLDPGAAGFSTWNPYRNIVASLPFPPHGAALADGTPWLLRMTSEPAGPIYFAAVDVNVLPTYIPSDGRGVTGVLMEPTSGAHVHGCDYLRGPMIGAVHSSGPTITGTQAPPTVSIKTDPPYVTHSYDQVARVLYRLDQAAHVTLLLLPPGIGSISDPSALVIVSNAARSANQDYAEEYVGFDSADVNWIRAHGEGAYTVAVVATSASTGMTTVGRAVVWLNR